jgi:hypothetical protein
LWRILGGVALVAVSVTAAILTMAGWLQLLPTAPAQSWLVFGLGLSLSSAAALWGVWILLGVFRDKDEPRALPKKE